MIPRRNRPRVVFDCNTLMQTLAFDHTPAAFAFSAFEAGDFDLFFSRAIMSEIRRVTRYPRVRAISSNMTEERIDSFLRRITYRAKRVKAVPRVFSYFRDPDDEPYLDLCVAARADFLVTHDRDLLSLMTEHSSFAKAFRQRTRPLRILKPINFLIAIGKPWKSTR